MNYVCIFGLTCISVEKLARDFRSALIYCKVTRPRRWVGFQCSTRDEEDEKVVRPIRNKVDLRINRVICKVVDWL